MHPQRDLPRKKELCCCLIQNAHWSPAGAVDLREFAAHKDFRPGGCEVIRPNNVLEQMLLLWPVSLDRGCTLINPSLAQWTNGEHTRRFDAGRLPDRIQHLAIQLQPGFPFLMLEVNPKQGHTLYPKAGVHTQEPSGA